MITTTYNGDGPLDEAMQDFYKESFEKMQNHTGDIRRCYADDGRRLSPDEIVLRDKDLEKGPDHHCANVVMRAKLQIESVTQHETCETLVFHGVGKTGAYPEDGYDEDNTFARWSPSVGLNITIANPDLIGKFKAGQKYYVDFTKAD